jgi:ABC-type phosphate transport system substrate-binding protein
MPTRRLENMDGKLSRYRRGGLAVIALAGSALVALVMAVPAGATYTPVPLNGGGGNTVINGGGSNTTYPMMQQLSDLYNSAPGCNLLENVQTSYQEVDYDCASSYGGGPAEGSENGYILTYPSVNPYNDVAWQEPAYGSSNGIKELEYEGSDEPTSAPYNEVSTLDFARSSRAAVISGTSPDREGLNFVAYAQDAVPWFHFNKVGGTTANGGCTSTPSKAVTSLSTTELASIYEGNTTNWSSVGGSNAPIYVFIAQSGSGTEATWAGDLNLSGSYPYGAVTDSTDPDFKTGLESEPENPFTPFENEVSGIFAANHSDPTADIACDAIFFFSYGKFTVLCPGGKCAGVPAANAGSIAALGKIGGVAANETTIDNGSFALDRELYNVYSDGSNSALPFPNSGSGVPPFINQAVQNFVSTYGFLCNPKTYKRVDPLSPTGATYGSEIDAIITAQGFFPFKIGVMGDAGITTPPDPSAPGYDAGYAAAEPTPAADKGYCRVTTTDGDGTP